MSLDTARSAPHARLLRLNEVLFRIQTSKTFVYDAIKRGEFPAAIKISRRAVAWLESDIDAWIESRIKAGGQ